MPKQFDPNKMREALLANEDLPEREQAGAGMTTSQPEGVGRISQDAEGPKAKPSPPRSERSSESGAAMVSEENSEHATLERHETAAPEVPWKRKAADKNLPEEIFSEKLSEAEKEVVAEKMEARPYERDEFHERGRKIDLDWLKRRAGRK